MRKTFQTFHHKNYTNRSQRNTNGIRSIFITLLIGHGAQESSDTGAYDT